MLGIKASLAQIKTFSCGDIGSEVHASVKSGGSFLETLQRFDPPCPYANGGHTRSGAISSIWARNLNFRLATSRPEPLELHNLRFARFTSICLEVLQSMGGSNCSLDSPL